MDRDKSPRGSIDIIASKYKGAVSYVDGCIGKLIDSLKIHDILEDTLIIITSDHGESLMEHGIHFDHHGLYEVTTHVPLILHYPRLFPQPKKIEGLIQHVDLVPTLCDYLRTNDNDLRFDGTSLKPLISREKNSLRKLAFFEESYVQRKTGIRNETFKYIYAPDGIGLCTYCQKVHAGVEELYDLGTDPEEKNNDVSKNRTTADRMRVELESVIRNLDSRKQQILETEDTPQTGLDDLQDLTDQKKIKKKLRSLGYMD